MGYLKHLFSRWKAGRDPWHVDFTNAKCYVFATVKSERLSLTKEGFKIKGWSESVTIPYYDVVEVRVGIPCKVTPKTIWELKETKLHNFDKTKEEFDDSMKDWTDY